MENPMCTLCRQFDETITHCFWHCSETQLFLKEIILVNIFQTQNVKFMSE